MKNISMEVFAYSCLSNWKEHLWIDSNFRERLVKESKDLGDSVYVERVMNWAQTLPIRSISELCFKFRSDELQCQVAFMMNVKNPGAWGYMRRDWNDNAMVNVVNTEDAQDTHMVPFEYQRIGLVGAQLYQSQSNLLERKWGIWNTPSGSEIQMQ